LSLINRPKETLCVVKKPPQGICTILTINPPDLSNPIVFLQASLGFTEDASHPRVFHYVEANA